MASAWGVQGDGSGGAAAAAVSGVAAIGASFAACDIGGDNDDHNDDKDNDEEGAEVLRWLASVRPAFKDLYGAKMVEQGYEEEKRSKDIKETHAEK